MWLSLMVVLIWVRLSLFTSVSAFETVQVQLFHEPQFLVFLSPTPTVWIPVPSSQDVLQHTVHFSYCTKHSSSTTVVCNNSSNLAYLPAFRRRRYDTTHFQIELKERWVNHIPDVTTVSCIQSLKSCKRKPLSRVQSHAHFRVPQQHLIIPTIVPSVW
jgi:hypothetical protein